MGLYSPKLEFIDNKTIPLKSRIISIWELIKYYKLKCKTLKRYNDRCMAIKCYHLKIQAIPANGWTYSLMVSVCFPTERLVCLFVLSLLTVFILNSTL